MVCERARILIERLNLQPHPEGGYYRETYRSKTRMPDGGAGGNDEAGGRAVSTAIYFLLCRGQASHLHRMGSDEVWHHYLGDPVELHTLTPETGHRCLVLGTDLAGGERPQLTIPGRTWFGARLCPGAERQGFALVGCTVAPGFEFSDFELGRREILLDAFPEHAAVVNDFT